MKQGWKEKTLNEVCIVERGSSPRPIQNYITDSPDGVNWIKIGDTKDVSKYIYKTQQKITKEGALKSRYVKEGDFIISNSMSFGKPYIMKTDGYIHDGWFVLRLNESIIDKDYFYYLLSSDFAKEQFNTLASGAIVQNISSDLIKKVRFLLPPLEDQQKIVEILDEAFEQIEQAKKNAQKNLQNTKDLFESYLYEIFNSDNKSWNIKTLGEIADIKGGKRVPKGYKLKNDVTNYPYIRVADFNDYGSVDLSDIHYIDEEVYSQIKNYTISVKDLYISIAGTIGKTGIIPEELDGANLTENACKLVFQNDIYNKFIYYFTKSKLFFEQAVEKTRTTAMPKLALTRLSSISVKIPSLPEQQEIVKKLDALSEETKQLEEIYQQKINNLEELKQSILQKAFNGELLKDECLVVV